MPLAVDVATFEGEKMKGFVFYKGRSPIDNAPIVGIATLESKNGKTGNMVQTWILREDMHPLEARATKADRAYCGDCPNAISNGAKHLRRFGKPTAGADIWTCAASLRLCAGLSWGEWFV
jgi:hypothetical protein